MNTNPIQTPSKNVRITLKGPLADAVRFAARQDRRTVSYFLDVLLPNVPEIAAALLFLAPQEDKTVQNTSESVPTLLK